MEEIFVRDEEIESPFDDSDADPDFLPAGNKIPQQAVFNKSKNQYFLMYSGH